MSEHRPSQRDSLRYSDNDNDNDNDLDTTTCLILEYLFCCKFSTNEEILDLLEDLATQQVKCHTSSKLKAYGDDYFKLYTDVLKHFNKTNTLEPVAEPPLHHNWSSIRKKTLKDLILKNFIIKIKNNHNFNEITTNNFKRDLTIGLNFKNINDKNIVMKNNEIETINGLNLADNAYWWDYNIFSFNGNRPRL